MSEDARSNEELTEATASGLRWIAFARIGTEVLLMGSMVVLAHLVSPKAFGMFAIAVIVQEIAMNVPSEGVGSAIVQRASITRAHLQAGQALSIAIGVVLAAITLALAATVVEPVFGSGTAELIVLTSPFFVIGALMAAPMGILRRRLDFRLLSILDLVQSSVRSVTSIVLAAAFGLQAPSLVLGALAAQLVVLLVTCAAARPPLPRWRRAEVADLLPYGGAAGAAAIAWTGFRNADYAVVGARLGAAQAGFYWRGFQLAVEYQRKLTSVMTQIGFPVLARAQSTDDMLVLRARMVQLLTVTMFPALVLLVILAPVLVPWLFGAEWAPAVLATQILTGAGVATLMIDQVGAVLMAAGRTRTMLTYGIAHFVVYVVAVVVAAPHGIAWVAGAAVGSHGIFLWIAYWLMLQDRPEGAWRTLWLDVSACALPCAALTAACVPLDQLLQRADVPAPIIVAVVSAVGGVVYLVVLRLTARDAWSDVMALIRRLVPSRPLQVVARRVPALAGRGG